MMGHENMLGCTCEVASAFWMSSGLVKRATWALLNGYVLP